MKRLRDPRWRLAAVLVTAAALAAILVGASRITAGGAGTTTSAGAPPTHPTPTEPPLLAGIEQHGAALGAPRAPVTLVEYADLQCPFCAQWARDALPTLVERYVRAGTLRIVFRGLAFIGPDSDKALRTAVAAGRENHLWDLVHGLYLRQGAENSGWVTDDLVTGIAAAVEGLDGEALLDARSERWVEPELKRTAAAAQAAGVHGTPSFQVGPTGRRLALVEVVSLGPEGIVPAIEAALAR
jgi:protein-disulfide isomerase